MPNRRRPAGGNRGRSRYLQSSAWLARRDRWFEAEIERVGTLRCALCLGAGTASTLELHHLDYAGVTQTATGWSARERHQDLAAMHPHCHDHLHRLIDRDRSMSGFVSRRVASAQAIARLQAKLLSFIESPE